MAFLWVKSTCGLTVFLSGKGGFFSPLSVLGVMRISFRWKKVAFLWVKKKPSPHGVFYPAKGTFFSPFSVLGVMRISFRWKKVPFLWVKRNLHLTVFFIRSKGDFFSLFCFGGHEEFHLGGKRWHFCG